MFFWKILTTFLVATIAIELYVVWVRGRAVAANQDAAYALDGKMSLLKCIGCLLVITVALIEWQVQMSADPHASGPIFLGFHLALVGMFVLVGLAIVLYATGSRTPNLHRKLVYPFFGLYAVVAVTGLIMLYNLPGPAS